MKYYRVIDYTLASKGLRFANYIIDMIIFNVFTFIVALGIGFILVLMGKDDMIDQFEGEGFLWQLLGMFCYGLFMFGSEVLFKGRTIGKFITGTKVVTEDEEELTTLQYFTRNMMRIIPLEALSFFGELGWHDKWSKSRVVMAKEFDYEKEVINSIDKIGKE